MSREEVKTAINELLEISPASALKEVLEYLKSVNNKSAHETGLSQDLRTILDEDQELLERLAK